ncbi:hypothetical protein HK414_14845 [Ramlibacter terrae]|uniref:GSCFA domain-containing protein n=1 Tax=Ramlibacter terrae TaxID=2732511 RepID=A0ABX6P325_9BURK|nr:hypothetical protein HK414_14845 [Ramlibacter terrae]
MKASGADYMDMEPRPAFIAEAEGKRFGYDTYSCRYGNVYTSSQLLQLAQRRSGSARRWSRSGRRTAASSMPCGLRWTPPATRRRTMCCKCARRTAARWNGCCARSTSSCSRWASPKCGSTVATARPIPRRQAPSSARTIRRSTPSATCATTTSPGTCGLSGNCCAPSTRRRACCSPSRRCRSRPRPATTMCWWRRRAPRPPCAPSPATAEDEKDIFYFPSYELISSHPGRGMFFEPDLRNVNDAGVRMVMGHFFRSFDSTPAEIADNEDLVCEEGELDKFSAGGAARAARAQVAPVASVSASAAATVAVTAAAPDDDEDDDGDVDDEDEDEDGEADRAPQAAPAAAAAVMAAPRVLPPPAPPARTRPVPIATVPAAPAASGAAQRRLVAAARERKEKIVALKSAMHQLKQELAQQRKASADAERAAALANARAERSRDMLSFQLGAVLLESTKSFGSFARLPARLLTLRRDARRRKEQADAAQRR